MNINPIIINGLSSLNIPVYPDKKTGKETKYIVFNYVYENVGIVADDEEQTDITKIQVHYFTKENPTPNKKAIRRLLRASGFTNLYTTQLFEDDTEYYHVIVECQIEGEIDD